MDNQKALDRWWAGLPRGRNTLTRLALQRLVSKVCRRDDAGREGVQATGDGVYAYGDGCLHSGHDYVVRLCCPRVMHFSLANMRADAAAEGARVDRAAW